MRPTDSLLRDCVERVRAVIGGRAPPPRILARGTVEGAAHALFVDGAGNQHAIPPRCVIGRDVRSVDLAILEESVSRRHARLTLEVEPAERWTLLDLDSTNGTFLDGRRLDQAIELGTGRLVLFGDVPLVFLTPPSTLELRIDRPGIGVLRYGSASVHLSGPELELVLRLARERRTPRAGGVVDSIHGFVRTPELASLIPSSPGRPAAVAVRQLAHRVRRALSALGRDDLLEASPRLGYRLLLVPTIET